MTQERVHFLRLCVVCLAHKHNELTVTLHTMQNWGGDGELSPPPKSGLLNRKSNPVAVVVTDLSIKISHTTFLEPPIRALRLSVLISDLRFFFFGVCAFPKIILQRNFGFSVRFRVPIHTGSCMEFTLVTPVKLHRFHGVIFTLAKKERNNF